LSLAIASRIGNHAVVRNIVPKPVMSMSRHDDRDDDDDDEDRDDDDDRKSSRRKRGRDRDDDDDDDLDIGRRSHLQPHRGTLILVFGLIGLIGGFLFLFPAVLAVVAWVMGNSDLKAMKDGQMDREGEGNTYAGYIMGIIGSAIGGTWIAIILASIVFSVLVPIVMGIGMFGACAGCMCCGAAAGPPPNGPGPGPPRRNF
jgi:hypothetical protein